MPLGMESNKHPVRSKAIELHIRQTTYMMVDERKENITNNRTSTKHRFSLQNGFDMYLNKSHKQQEITTNSLLLKNLLLMDIH